MSPRTVPALSTIDRDIQREILSHCSYDSLAMLRASSPYWRRHVDDYIHSVWIITLAKYFANTTTFCDLLRRTSSIVSGSLILWIILQGTNFQTWLPGDMDLYVPIHAAVMVLEYLRDTEGYIATYSEHDLSGLPMRGYVGGIASVIKLHHPTRRTYIDVVISIRASAIFPLALFWGTPVINFFAADSLCIAYPRWTLRGTGCIRPTIHGDRRIMECAIKYHMHGFELLTFSGAAGRDHRKVGRYCPHSYRRFGDAASMSFSFVPGVAAFSPQFCDIRWRFGGPECPICARASDFSVLLVHNA